MPPKKKQQGESNRQFHKRIIDTSLGAPLLVPEDMEKIPYPMAKPIETDEEMQATLDYWTKNGITEVAIDTEFESCFHYQGLLQLCLIQVFDGTRYYLIDAIKLTQGWIKRDSPLYVFFSSRKLKKIIFSASGDIAMLKRHGLVLDNACDIQRFCKVVSVPNCSLVTYIKMFLGVNVMGGKVASEEDVLENSDEGQEGAAGKSEADLAKKLKKEKKKKQMSDWMVRPIPADQACYALSDVEYLFRLRDVLLEKISVLDKSNPGIYDAAIRFAEIKLNGYLSTEITVDPLRTVTKRKGVKGIGQSVVKGFYEGVTNYSCKNAVAFDSVVPDLDAFIQCIADSLDAIKENDKGDLTPIVDEVFSKIGSNLDEEPRKALVRDVAKKCKSKIKTYKQNEEKRKKREAEKALEQEQALSVSGSKEQEMVSDVPDNKEQEEASDVPDNKEQEKALGGSDDKEQGGNSIKMIILKREKVSKPQNSNTNEQTPQPTNGETVVEKEKVLSIQKPDNNEQAPQPTNDETVVEKEKVLDVQKPGNEQPPQPKQQPTNDATVVEKEKVLNSQKPDNNEQAPQPTSDEAIAGKEKVIRNQKPDNNEQAPQPISDEAIAEKEKVLDVQKPGNEQPPQPKQQPTNDATTMKKGNVLNIQRSKTNKQAPQSKQQPTNDATTMKKGNVLNIQRSKTNKQAPRSKQQPTNDTTVVEKEKASTNQKSATSEQAPHPKQQPISDATTAPAKAKLNIIRPVRK